MITHTGYIHRVLFPTLLWRMPGEKIFLTFDDGPHPDATPRVLDMLGEHNVRGTFFLTGKNILMNAEIVRRIINENHSIGIHAYNHTRSLAFSKEKTKREIEETIQVISSIKGKRTRLFRPPFGLFSHNTIAAARELNFLIVMWSCLTGDFRNWEIEKVVSAAVTKIEKGSILVFHDNEKTKSKISQILNLTIPKIKDLGFEFGAIR